MFDLLVGRGSRIEDAGLILRHRLVLPSKVLMRTDLENDLHVVAAIEWARLVQLPELLFLLRGVDPAQIIAKSGACEGRAQSARPAKPDL